MDYFALNHDVGVLADVDWEQPPTHSDTRTNLNFKNSAGSFWDGGATDRFALRATSVVEVEEGRTYWFEITSTTAARSSSTASRSWATTTGMRRSPRTGPSDSTPAGIPWKCGISKPGATPD